MRVLAVDDKAMPRKVLERAIREAAPDAEIITCANAGEALAVEDVGGIDVAFVDIDMPGKNGLALARELKRVNPRINIIFATGYGEFMADAFEMHSSGYLMKPVTAHDVADELENLRFHAEEHSARRLNGLVVRCFGNFEAFSDGQALSFRRTKSKELLAYLVDRQGAVVPLREIEAALWDEESGGRQVSGSYLRTLVADLSQTLEAAGHADVLVRRYGAVGVDMGAFACDYYDFLASDPVAIASWHGEYMSQYSWAEPTKAALLRG